MKTVITFLSLIVLFVYSCGSPSSAQSNVSALIHKNVLSWSDIKSAEILELSLIQDITALDSLKFLSKNILYVNESYAKDIKSLKTSASLLYKAKKQLYYGTSKNINPYYKNECDDYLASMKKICKRLNTYSDGLNGKFEGDMSHIFKAYYSLKNKKSDVSVGKIYEAKIKYTTAVWYGSTRESNPHGNGTQVKTEVRYFLLNSTETAVIRTLHPDEITLLQQPQEQFDEFGKFSVDDEGNIKRIEVEHNNDQVESVRGETTVVASMISAEFFGACYVRFRNDAGEEITFYNPNLGVYGREDGVCGVLDKYSDKKFKLTYHPSTAEIYIEDEGDQTVDTNIITSIELVKN